MSGEALAATVARNQAIAMALPFADRRDFDDAQRGFVAALNPGVVTGTGGRVVWDADSYGFLDGECPDTVNPSLWRQAQLVTMQGLFEVAPGFFQVRGLDLSNMTIIEGERGVLVIDPLISSETARAALDLYREHRGDRPVTGMIYTHSHVDHFGGVKGVLGEAEVAGGVPVIAPEHFVEHAVAENLYAGTAMSRRAGFMYGATLPKSPTGQVTAGLGATTSTGTVTLIRPTIDIVETGQELTIDGIRIIFQLTPGTEAPAEMNFFFPDHGLLCAAENATHNLHNTLTLRGALVRDPHEWSRYLDETITMFGADTDAVFASHHWPRWGNADAVDFLGKQRDLYGYLHDQALRLLNRGYTGPEIAEMVDLPPSLADEWHCRGYYGSVSHNLKAIYQRYLGWYDGNPAHLWSHPPVEAAVRYVEFMGGADAVVARARESFDAGDYRWTVEVLNHVVFADPSNEAARELEAQAYEQLAYGAENGVWRNFFLTAAAELRGQAPMTPLVTGSPDLAAQITASQLFDSLAIRLDAARAVGSRCLISWRVTDDAEDHVVRLENCVLTHRSGSVDDAEMQVTCGRSTLAALATGTRKVEDVIDEAALHVTGDRRALVALFDLFDAPDPNFAIVIP